MKKLLWVLTVLSDWLEFFVEDIFHIAQSRTLYLCTFLASKIGLVAKIEFPLVPIVTYSSLELVCMDFLTLEKSKGGYQHILVITDVGICAAGKTSCCRSSSSMVVILYKMLLISFILLYSVLD
jgi:hypothetical protein